LICCLSRLDAGAFADGGVAEFAELAALGGAIGKFDGDHGRPAGLGEGDIGHDADDAGELVDHDFAEKTFAGGRYFSFGHGGSLTETIRFRHEFHELTKTNANVTLDPGGTN